MTEFAIYSYLTEDDSRAYLDEPIIQGSVKHGDIISNDNDEWVIFIENPHTGALKGHTPTRCTIDRLNAFAFGF